MPNVRVVNTIPNVKRADTISNIRIVNTIPQATRKTDLPQSRVSRFQTGKIGEPKIISKIGVPIGLLLTLTYIEEVSLSSLFYSDFRPTARVTNP